MWSRAISQKWNKNGNKLLNSDIWLQGTNAKAGMVVLLDRAGLQYHSTRDCVGRTKRREPAQGVG